MAPVADKEETVPCGDDVAALVLDLGTHAVRFGYSGEDCPRQVWPSVVGVDSSDSLMDGGDSSHQNVLFPLDFHQQRDNLEVRACLRYLSGQYSLDRDAFSSIVEGISGPNIGLNAPLKGKPLLVTEPTRHCRHLRSSLMEVLFDQFEVEAVYLAKHAVLSAFAAGRSSACVVDVGAHGFSVTPVQDGYTLQRNMLELPIGGDELDNQLAQLLSKRSFRLLPAFGVKKLLRDLSGTVDRYINVDTSMVHSSYLEYSKRAVIRNIKESICKCATHPSHVEMWPSQQTKRNPHPPVNATICELPDGSIIPEPERLGTLVSELLFNPSVFMSAAGVQGLCVGPEEYCGIPSSIVGCVSNCDVDIRRDLYGGIVLTGGTSLISGFPERIAQTISEDSSVGSIRVKFVAPASAVERRFSTWIGGSILSSLATFQQMWLSKYEYQEHGSSLAERKCLQ